MSDWCFCSHCGRIAPRGATPIRSVGPRRVLLGPCSSRPLKDADRAEKIEAPGRRGRQIPRRPERSVPGVLVSWRFKTAFFGSLVDVGAVLGPPRLKMAG